MGVAVFQQTFNPVRLRHSWGHSVVAILQPFTYNLFLFCSDIFIT